jgi:N-acetyl-1-D-myo-inositol-2-amino-2-deoxy-alpha-D-glucopyranoside deacetylase
MAETTPDRRLLLVHAHPDDESINNGATMAKYVAEGAHVTLVTCTLGEEGEILVPEIEHLASHADDGLGEHRIGELAAAMEALGVTDHRFLGGAGRFRDSGMVWDDDGGATAGDDVRDDAFWRADLLEASDLLVEVIREVRPQVLVTYNEYGGYGHPDHIQAHRVATYATALAAVPSYRTDLGEPWDIAKIYWTALSESRLRDMLRQLRASGDTQTLEGMEPDGPLPPFVTPDKLLTATIDATAYGAQKLTALQAHASQVDMDSGYFAFAKRSDASGWGFEDYRLAKGTPGPVDPESGLESDLFAGLD